jgi:uncharacterized membrane protein YgcG
LAPVISAFRQLHVESSTILRMIEWLSSSTQRRCVLSLDGLDEVWQSIEPVLDWIETLDARFSVVLTSRPTVITAAISERLAKMGFEARKIVELTPDKARELSDRMLTRLCVAEDAAKHVHEQLSRPAYASLVRVPITLTLLIHALLRGSGGGEGGVNGGGDGGGGDGGGGGGEGGGG